jgi:uncharacterized protein (TIGR03790 family)
MPPTALIRTRPARCTAWLAAGLLALLAACGGGGGGESSSGSATPTPPAPSFTASNLAVLIAEGDATSEAIGLAYQRARGVPDSQVIRLAVPRGGGGVLSAAEFTTLKAALDARLPANVQATLVTWSQPSRVVGACSMGLTSALAFGYAASYCGECNSTTVSRYYDSPTRQPFTDLGIRPSMMLGAATLAEAEALIARGVAADRSWLPTAAAPASGRAVLIRTTDTLRSVRFDDFRSVAATPVARLTVNLIDNAGGQLSDFVVNQTDLMFYFTGLVTVPQIASHRWLPGAVADHLTSLAGVTEPGGPNLGQMPATAWLQAGATASYGTVEEPCNFEDKFPRASVLVRRYAAGETLIEAYWKSVRTPGQGLFVGEPLARPWGN